MISLLATIALLQTIKVDYAEGHSGYQKAEFGPNTPKLDLDKTGEPFKAYRQGKNIRVELGDSLVLLCIDAEQYAIADLKKKVGVRYLVKSKAFPEGEAEENFSSSRYQMEAVFPLWPDRYLSYVTGEARKRIESAEKSQGQIMEEVKDPLLGDAVMAIGSTQMPGQMMMRRRDFEAAPCVLRWFYMQPDEQRIMAYTTLFKPKEVKADIFSLPKDVRFQDRGAGSTQWTVFKDQDAFYLWLKPLQAEHRKPKK